MGFWDSVNAERLLHGVEAEQLTLGHCLSARRWTVGILATSPDMFTRKTVTTREVKLLEMEENDSVAVIVEVGSDRET